MGRTVYLQIINGWLFMVNVGKYSSPMDSIGQDSEVSSL